ncbi:Endonuclease/exonuclease/phosphatase [Chaetomium tenue]|uniref:Endonuclease/exonuclease/phosphatase n=1 Tax=Chaetomium tenue TaxID=1854479 RepID=A0ACB7NX29_9PEZI|nr:Endonuclease/exonuclease/phosphatase [Chaetomium globosum]
MAFLSHFRTQILSWWQDTPLPAGAPAAFQSWNEFDERANQWRAVGAAQEVSPDGKAKQGATDRPYTLVTWNVDYSSPLPGQRLSAILSRLLSLSPAVDIIFLQELSREAFQTLLNEPEIRKEEAESWFLSDADAILPAGQSFTTITLLSKARFQKPGPLWRVKYRSRFERDALCCDVFAPTATDEPGEGTRMRLVNVHLDPLPIQPSLRPNQVSIIAALLRSAGRGLVAGDFNPVLPAGSTLVQDNGLVDSWAELHPDDPGFTWGVDVQELFPPNRMDKVAVVGLRAEDMEILPPGNILRGEQGGNSGEDVAWSDHSGLRCAFKLEERH